MGGIALTVFFGLCLDVCDVDGPCFVGVEHFNEALDVVLHLGVLAQEVLAVFGKAQRHSGDFELAFRVSHLNRQKTQRIFDETIKRSE